MIFIATDILNPYKREILSQNNYNTLIDFLVEQFPDGFKRPTDISVNGHEVALADYDIELKEDDVIVLLDRAALPVGLIGGWFITALANLAISVTLSYVANKLFAPDAPQDQGTPSSVYNLNSAQNIARFGSPIPIIYGKVRAFPSMIVQPYYKFEGNIEYLYHVLCVGQGTLTTDEILIGDDSITGGDLQWKLLYPNSFYNIPLNAYGVHLSKTLSSPSNMEIEVGDGESEKYTISKDAQYVEFDYMYPNGLIYYEGDGNDTSAKTSFTARIYTYNGAVYTQVGSEVFYKNVRSVDAIQETYRMDISAYDEPIYISFEKTLNAASSFYITNTYIKRVKAIYPNEDFTQRYGDVTLLATKIKATNAVSSAGQVKVNGYFTRTDVGNTMSEVLTDLYTNTKYGGGLSASDLDFPVTTETVNCAYDQNITLFDAMRRPAQAQGYSLYLAGMDVILKKDGVNNITTAMYNEMNILRNSFKAQYLFKEEYPANDGFRCNYIDGDGWAQKSSIYPLISSRPQVVDLFGVVEYPLVPGTSSDASYSPGIKQISADGKVFSMYAKNVTLRASDLSSILWNVGSLPFTDYRFRGIHYDDTNDEYYASGYYTPNTAYSTINAFVVRISSTGTLLQTYKTSDDGNWGGSTNNSDVGQDIFFKNGIIYISGYWQYRNSTESIRQGYLSFDKTTGAIHQVIGASARTYSSSTTSIAMSSDSDVMYIGCGSWMDGTLAQHFEGKLLKGTIGGSFSVLDVGNRDSTGHPNAFYKFASTIKKVGDYLLVMYGFNFSDAAWINAINTGGSYSNQIDIYNYESGEFVKSINVDSVNDISVEYGNEFGFNIFEFGDYIFISAARELLTPTDTSTAFGAVYIYSSNFTKLGRLPILPLLYSNQLYGYNVWGDSNYIYVGGTQLRSGVGADTMKKITYDGSIYSGSAIAERMSKYLYKQDESRRKIVSFSTDIQGLVPQFLDKIMVSHSSLQWGEAGEVIGRSSDNLVISDALEDLTGSKTIVFRNIDGSVSDPYSVNIIDESNITVTGMPSWVTDGIFYTIQDAGTAKEFLVIAVKPSGDTVQIDCVNYDESIYS